MVWPTKPSMAGSRVTEAIMVTRTAAAEPTDMPWRKGRFMSSRPSTEMMTVVPANSTALPAVVMAVTVASSGSWPACRLWRYRVTMNRA